MQSRFIMHQTASSSHGAVALYNLQLKRLPYPLYKHALDIEQEQTMLQDAIMALTFSKATVAAGTNRSYSIVQIAKLITYHDSAEFRQTCSEY